MPGPPWSRTSVGFSRIAGPSGTRRAPSTSKNSRTPFTSTCIRFSPVRREFTPDDVPHLRASVNGLTTPSSQSPNSFSYSQREKGINQSAPLFYQDFVGPGADKILPCQETPDTNCRLRPTAFISFL